MAGQTEALPFAAPGTVFVVDDEPMVTAAIQAYLCLETDHTVHTFNSPLTALEALETLRPEVIISDFLMPGMDGIAFLQRVKDQLPEATLILLTGYADKENAIQAINRVGIYRYIEKPWDNDELRLNIQNGLERARLVANLRETIGSLFDARQALERYNRELEALVEARTLDLKKTYDTLQGIVRNTTDGIVTIDQALTVTSINPAAEHWVRQLLGLKLEDGPLPRLQLTDVLTRPSEAQLMAVLMSDIPSRLTEAAIGEIPLEVSLSPLPMENGFVLVMRDITQRKEIDRLREDFVSTLTHDLRTPLLAAIQTLGFLLDGSQGPITDRQRQILQMLVENNQTLLNLVNALLDVYRYESGRQRLILDLIDLSVLLGSVIQELSALAQSKQQTLTLADGRPQLPPVRGDRQELRRVFVNLIGNAIHYTQPGGQIQVLAGCGDEGVAQVDVVDNGRGIPERDLPALFQRFSQGTSKQRTSGTGLGLYLTRQIVEAHQGQIFVESVEGRGSRFTVVLPSGVEA